MGVGKHGCCLTDYFTKKLAQYNTSAMLLMQIESWASEVKLNCEIVIFTSSYIQY